MRRSLLFIALVAGSVLVANAQAQFFQIAPQVRSAGSYLGVMLIDINPDRAAALKLGDERGVEVTNVEPGSPAENAGLKPGDVLFSYNGENILGVQQFIRLVQETPPGRRVKIQLWRGGKVQGVTTVTGTARPPAVDFPRLVGFVPDARNLPLSLADFPDPILVWKNSMLGIECEPMESQLAQYFGVKRGALIRSVDKGSPAERAGLKAGDVVTSIGDRSVSSPRDVTSYTRTSHQPGRSIVIALTRNHKELTLTVPMDNAE